MKDKLFGKSNTVTLRRGNVTWTIRRKYPPDIELTSPIPAWAVGQAVGILLLVMVAIYLLIRSIISK